MGLSLTTRAWASLVALALAMGALLFGSAGTFDYWQGWLYLTVFLGGSAIVTLYLLRRDPALLERRMRGGPTAEKERSQRIIMLFTSVGFIALLVVPAVDHRSHWSNVPPAVALAGNLVVAVGLYLIFLVYRANTYASATIAVTSDQKVISTGPYAVVRHPMYASALLYLGATPIALGSYWGLVVVAGMVPFLIWRLLDEERLLARELPGYAEYQQRVRHRLVPYLW